MRSLAVVEYRVLELALILLVLLNGISITSRFLFRHALGELFEVMILGGIAAYWIAIATAEREKAHLGVDSFVMLFPYGLQRVARFAKTAVVAAFYSVVVWSGVLLVLRQYSSGATAGLIDLPLWTVAAFMPLGAAIALWRCLTLDARDPGSLAKVGKI